MKLLIGLLAMPLAVGAQAPATWGGGVGVGNVLEAHFGVQRRGWIALGRTQYRWWRPSEGAGSSWLDEVNARSQQLELAVLGGYGVQLGRSLLYSGVGLSYLRGRQLNDLRYAVRKSSSLGNSYFYSYRDYQALGLPVEVGLVLRPFGAGRAVGVPRLGLAFQADFNPERPIYAGVLTLWMGSFGSSPRAAY